MIAVEEQVLTAAGELVLVVGQERVSIRVGEPGVTEELAAPSAVDGVEA